MSAGAVTVRIDGASRGNPGPAGIGAVVEFGDGRQPMELCAYIGETTNNVAEYRALLLALEEAARHEVSFLTDRRENRKADSLANLAIDQRRKG